MGSAIPVLERLGQALDRQRSAGQSGSEVWAPGPLALQALAELLGKEPGRRALDPWATNGVTLTFAVESGLAGSGVGLVRAPDNESLTSVLAEDLPVEWEAAREHDAGLISASRDYAPLGRRAEEDFDLVVSMPPWGLRWAAGKRVPRAFQRDPVCEVLLAAWARLTTLGVAGAVLPRRFLIDRRDTIFTRLKKMDLFVASVVELPPGSFSPATQMPGSIVIVRRGSPRRIATARLTGEANRDALALENVQRQAISPTDVALGFLVASGKYRGLDAEIADQRMRRLAGSTKWPRVPLDELILGIQMGRQGQEFEPAEGTVYVPLIGNSPARTRTESLTLKPHNYAQVRVKPESLDPEWLAGYLSAPVGLAARETVSAGAVIPKISKTTLPDLPVFRPPLAEQQAASGKAQTIRLLRDQLSQLERDVWTDATVAERLERVVPAKNADQAFKDWMGQLPFPIASIVWAYQAAGGAPRAQYEHLLHFFEALAEFHAVILLSAVTSETSLKEELLPKVHEALVKNNLSFDRASFGTWRVTFENLAKQLRILSDDKKGGGAERLQNVLKTDDSTTLSMFLGKGIPAILQRTNKYRNEWRGHGGVVGEEESRRRRERLEAELSSYREIIEDGWSRYELVLAGQMRYRRNRFLTTLERVMGTTTPFEKFESSLSMPLEVGRLHLLAKGKTEALKLLPLVRVMPSPKTGATACYFYDKQRGENTRFVSYHFEPDSEVLDKSSDMAETIRLLGSNDSISPNIGV